MNIVMTLNSGPEIYVPALPCFFCETFGIPGVFIVSSRGANIHLWSLRLGSVNELILAIIPPHCILGLLHLEIRSGSEKESARRAGREAAKGLRRDKYDEGERQNSESLPCP